MILFVIFLSYFLLFVVNFIIWWGFFIILTIIGLMKLKLYNSSMMGMIYYFVVQELLGLFFVLCLRESLIFLSLLIKGGFSPFHFWIMKLSIFSKNALVWFLTLQKTAYYLILPFFISWFYLIFLFFMSLIPLFQAFFVLKNNLLLFLILTSRGNYILLLGYWEYIICLIIFPLYLLFMYYVISRINPIVNNYELYFILMSFPGGLPFFVKLFLFYLMVNLGGLLVLFSIRGLVINIYLGITFFYSSRRFSTNNKLIISLILISFFIVILLI